MGLKLLCDAVLQYIADPSALAAQAGGSGGAAAEAVDRAVVEHTLPLIPVLLEDEDPMPLYALKMLSVLLAAEPAWVLQLAELGQAARFFLWLAVDHPHNNVHNIRVCSLVVRAGAVAAAELEALRAAQRALSVLRYAVDNGVEPFVEPSLELCLALLQAGAAAAAVLPGLPVFVGLCSHQAGGTSLAAARCLACLARADPARTTAALASEGSIAALAAALEDCGDGETCAVLLHVLRAAWGLPDALEAAGLGRLRPRLQAALDSAAQRGAAAEAR